MENTVKAIKSKYASAKIIIGGAPVTHDFARTIGADAYAPASQGAVDYLKQVAV